MANTNSKDPALADKVAVVVGGGRGIGQATARKLASAGASVVVASRTSSELDEIVADIQADGGEASAIVADASQREDVQALAEFVREVHGRVDVLVNSAGTSLIASLEATSEMDWDHVVDTNLKAPFLCTRAMLDLLRASESGQVISIASKVGLTGHRYVTAYTAAKAGLIGFSRALSDELSHEGIRVIVLCPGPVDTPMRWEATPSMDPGLAIPADTVAETILFLVGLNSKVTVNELVVEAVAYDDKAVLIEG
ncbi:MAG: SDR family oxidoreductase [Anaerolineales bacterium]